MAYKTTIAGDSVITIELDEAGVSEQLAHFLAADEIDGVLEYQVCSQAVTVFYNPLKIDYATLEGILETKLLMATAQGILGQRKARKKR